MKKFLVDTLANISENIFANHFVSGHSKHNFYFEKKTCIFLAADMSAKNAVFLRAPFRESANFLLMAALYPLMALGK